MEWRDRSLLRISSPTLNISPFPFGGIDRFLSIWMSRCLVAKLAYLGPSRGDRTSLGGIPCAVVKDVGLQDVPPPSGHGGASEERKRLCNGNVRWRGGDD